MPQSYISYTVIMDSQPSERRIIVVNGIPFYSSTGTSDDKEEVISPAWRQELWMPIAGVKTGEKAGQLSKLGEHVREKTAFEHEITPILQSVYKSMNQEEADYLLRSLLLDKYKAPLFSDPSSSSYIAAQDIILALAGQFTRFGTIEAMIISMKISSDAWAKNALLKNFMQRILILYQQFAFYDAFDLSHAVKNAKQQVSFTVQQEDNKERDTVSLQMNAWLLNQITITAKTRAKNVSIMEKCLSTEVVLTFALSGTLILGSIINLGLAYGVDSAAMAGLTAAAATGFGLLLTAAALIVIEGYLLWKAHVNVKQQKQALAADEDTRSAVNTFLKKNSSFVPTLPERVLSPTKASSSCSSFFSNTVQAIKEIFNCSTQYNQESNKNL